MNDLISKAEVLLLLESMMETYWDRKQILSVVRSNIEKLPSAEEWIPVTKSLPKKGGWYFVTWEDQFKTVRRVAVSKFIEPKGLTDIGHFEGFVLNEVIAWTPLPEPYKGGDA